MAGLWKTCQVRRMRDSVTAAEVFRCALGLLLGAVVWKAVSAGLFAGLRLAWPAFAAVEPERAYTLGMLLVRLILFAIMVAAASAVATLVSRHAWMPVLAGLVILLPSFWIHVTPPVWEAYPVWYHVVYVAYIVPIAVCAGRAALRSRG